MGLEIDAKKPFNYSGPVFDAHFHIIDYSYPVQVNQNYQAPEYLVEQYISQTQDLKIGGGAIVSGSFQGYDQGYLKAALTHLGEGFVGVSQIPPTITDAELEDLHQVGVRAIRFNLKRGGSADLSYLEEMSARVWEAFRWHVEVYLDSKVLGELKNRLKKLPAFSIDHLGLSKEGLNDLYELLEEGARVKATGFGRLNFDPLPVMQKIYSLNPQALMFGSDLPSTRAPSPFSFKDIERIQEHFSDKEQADIFYKNAQSWYFRGNA